MKNQIFLFGDAFAQALDRLAQVAILGEETHAYAKGRIWKAYARRLENRAEEGIAALKKEAGAVARGLIAARCAAVEEILQNNEALLDQLMSRLTMEISEKTDTAPVVLVLRII